MKRLVSGKTVTKDVSYRFTLKCLVSGKRVTKDFNYRLT